MAKPVRKYLTSVRFIVALAEWPGKPDRFIEILRMDRWLEGWLIHDWLDYAGRCLYVKYKSRQLHRWSRYWPNLARTMDATRGMGATTMNIPGDATGMRAG